jgi:hypothetical protein
MAVRWLISGGGNFSSTSVWNDGTLLGIPTTGDDVFTNGFTVNMDTNATVNSLNNTARARDIATPLMTANNAPSPYVAAASSIAGAGVDAWRAFDRNYASGSNFWQAAAGTPQWISMDFGSTIIIDAYTIFGTSNQSFNTRNWTFEGSNNNVSWTTLHTVTLPSAIAASGSYSSGSISNPTAYRYYRINISLTGGGNAAISELELYQPGTAALASGGSFIFNSGSISGSATSTTAALSQGTTGLYLVQVTATTGTVTLNLSSNVEPVNAANIVLINHSGNCNLNLNGQNFRGTSGGGGSPICIGKSSTGTITITGNLIGTSGAALSSTNGNTILTGNVIGGTGGGGHGILQTAGNVTVTGNVTGGTSTSIHGISLTGAASQFTINGDVRGGSASSAHGINFGGTLGTVNGNVTGGGGSGARGISTDTGGVNVTGNIIGNSASNGIVIAANSTIVGNIFGGGANSGISSGSSNNSLTVTVTGDVYASTTQSGIALVGTGTQVVNLTGNMYNTLGRSAIWCPNVFISNTATTLWRMDTGGGNYKFLYSADSTPNLPATTNVRNGVTFGPALSLTGTMVVPSASDVRENVPVDNTVGTGELTSADIISGINASSDDLAVRLKNTLTDTTAGNIISQYNNS